MSTQSVSSDFSRRSANFHPSVWGDHFIRYVCEPVVVDEEIMKKHASMMEKVRKMLAPAEEKASRPLTVANLIDSIQQLGLDYHFEHEISELLQYIHNGFVENGIITLNEDLHSIALVFRLLRQQGYRISPDVFNKFRDEQGTFNQELITDVEGMISLYEAAYLGIHGEHILDEAIAFTSSHLKLIPTQSPFLQMKVNNCLKRPLHKNIPRLVARNYIYTCEENPSHDEALLLFAKLDFNILQTQYQREVGNVSKWWKDHDFATQLPFSRDRIVECYYWILGVYFEPQYSLGRILMTKFASLLTILDDMYDAYGTFEELKLFTEAIQRWDITCLDFLPAEYMKFLYKALLDFYEEIEQEMAKEGRTFCVIYARNEMKRAVQAYLDEAKWFNNNYIPTMDEYMGVALVTAGSRNLTTIGFIGMRSIATENAFKWITSYPKIVTASDIVCRLMDDIVTTEFDISAIDCYMKQNGVTKQETINEFLRQVENGWKDMNEELLDPTQLPKPLLVRVINLCRIVDVLYKNGDDFTNSSESTKKNIEALLLSPWPV